MVWYSFFVFLPYAGIFLLLDIPNANNEYLYILTNFKKSIRRNSLIKYKRNLGSIYTQ